MRVLYATPFVPWPLDTGGRLRAFHLARTAAQHVPLELHAVAEPRDLTGARRALEPHFDRLVIHDRSRPPFPGRLGLAKPERWFHSEALKFELARRATSRSQERTVLFLEEVFLARQVPPALRPYTLVGRQKIDSVFHAQTHPAPTTRQRIETRRLERLEAFAAEHFSHHLTCSQGDATNLTARFPGSSEPRVLPSGFDPEFFTGQSDPALRQGGPVVFLGSLDYAPNQDALEHLVQDILPLLRATHPDAKVQLVGRRPSARARELVGPNLELHSDVPDVRPFLERAACVVVPLRIGGGTRLKIVEALALGCPLVSTTTGAQGLELTPNQHLLVADEPVAFAAAVARLLDGPEQASALGRAGAEAVHRIYPWNRLGERLIHLLRPLCESPSFPAPRL